MYRAGFNQRYNIGKASEELVLPKLIKYFARDIVPTTDKFAKYDFTCSEYNYELKSRNCALNTYKTSMIGLNKMGDKSILIFKFSDSLAYCEYNKEKFSTYSIEYVTMYDHPIAHIFIPIKDLKVIETY